MNQVGRRAHAQKLKEDQKTDTVQMSFTEAGQNEASTSWRQIPIRFQRQA